MARDRRTLVPKQIQVGHCIVYKSHIAKFIAIGCIDECDST
jgi:hypothetical protein